MARILVSAYACGPGLGSEAEGGWSWVRWTADAGHEVVVVTQPAFADALDGETPPGVEVVGVPPEPWATAFRGHPRVYADYLAWQQACVPVVRALHARRPLDLIHHVSWGSLIWGTPLWQVDAPLAFGPIGGGQVAPAALRDYFGDAWAKERLRTALVQHALPHNPRARATLAHARLVAVTNDATESIVRRLGATTVLQMLDSGLPEADEAYPAPPPTRPAGRIELVWIGRILALKALPLALEAVAAAVGRADVHLTVVGDGDLGPSVDGWIADLGLTEHVTWLGQVPHQRIRPLLRDSDALLFTSLRESFGSQVLEAAAQARPVIALDLHGVATHVPHGAGRRVPAGDRRSTVAGLADAIVDLAHDPAARLAAGAVARDFALAQRWPARVARLHRAAGIAPVRPDTDRGEHR